LRAEDGATGAWTPDAVLAKLARTPAGPWWRGVLIGLGFAAAALFVRWAGQAFYGQVTGFIILLPAVVLAGLAAGRTAGIVATLACLFGGWVVAGPSATGVGIGNAMGRIATVNFVIVGLFLAIVAASLRKTLRRLDDTIDALGGSDEALLRSENRFRTAVDAVRGILWTNTPEGRMEGEQPGWSALTGQSRSQYEGYGWSEAVHPDDAQPTVDAWNAAVAGRRAFDFQHRVKTAGGDYRTYAIRAVPTLDRTGHILEWVGVHIDVTEARSAEVALRESEARFRLMADTAPSPVWLTDAEGNVEFVNRALEVFYGKPGDTFLGQVWKESVHPEDIDGVNAIQAAARATRSPYGFECRFQRHDGVWRWMRISVNPRFDGAGVFLGYVGMAFDVTDTRAALDALAAQERRQRFLLELSDGVRELEDPSAIMDHVQSVLGRMLGASRVGYGEFSEDRQTIELTPDWTEGVPSIAGRIRVPDLGEGVMAELFLGLTVAVDDVAADVRSASAAASLAASQIQSFVAAPLFRAGEMRAFLYVHAARPRVWSPEDVALISDVADRTWAEVERARAEAELRESEARFRDIADTAPVLIWVTGQDRVRAFVNQAYVDYHGGTYEEARLAEWRTMIHPDDQARVVAESMAGEATGEPFSLEARYLRHDGAYRWLKSFSRPRLGAGGQVLGFVGVAFDVTDIRESNDRLATAMAERDAILSQLAEGVIVTDPDGAIVFVNEAARRHHGVAELGVGPDEYANTYRLFTEDGRPYPPDELPLARTVRHGETITDARWRIRRPDGTEVIAVGNTRPVSTADGRTIGAVLTLRDDTARVQAEQRLAESEARFRTVADSAPVPIWMGDETGKVMFANLAYRTFFQVVDRALQGGWTGMMSTDDLTAFKADYGAAFDRREPYDGMVRVAHPELGERWLRCQGVPRFDAAGKFQGYIGVNLDITDAKRAEADLKRINELLEERVGEALAEKAKAEADLMHAQRMEAVGRLTGGVAHDFNNLLTVVIGALDMILRSPDDASRRQKMGEAALAAARRGERLTHQLLAFSRRQTLRPEPVDLNALVRQSDPLLRRAVGEAVEYRLKLKRGGARVVVDPAQFEAALLNLIVNARDAIAEGDGAAASIRVETRRCRVAQGEVSELAAGDYLCISVTDTGVGMDEETRRRVFEPFFTTKAVGKGTGLGLSQVYGFARQSGGGVRLISAPGEGTTVEIFLPPGVEAETVVEDVQADGEAVTGRLLLVEDDPAVAAIALDLLTAHGLQVEMAENGPEALRRLQDQGFDIMMTDVVMPGGMSGLDLARRAAGLYPKMRILLASGYAGDDVDADLAGAAWPLLRKPYSRDDLFAALAQARATTP
jgi:PAS domain S-box-containing protein